MAYYDSFGGFNRLTKIEIINRNIVRTIFWLSLFDLLSLTFHASRVFHFQTAPDALWHSTAALFLLSAIRMQLAMVFGRDPYMEASYAWRARKDLLEAYDFIGPGPDYSSRRQNWFYFTTLVCTLSYLVYGILKIS